ncbi:hypothetical protein HNR05_000380 [Leifsonia psychrotolerans]|uniref:Uncharacterized protein n=1 Tax=Glaciibacter psychrotolerans TaxID=670054 RepID=A0A7Z0J564_9MICO|nr:hypothetical protein [Leifsonia psychrotolerans]
MVSRVAHGISTSSISGRVRSQLPTVGRACRDLVPRFRDWLAGSRRARSTEGYGLDHRTAGRGCRDPGHGLESGSRDLDTLDQRKGAKSTSDRGSRVSRPRTPFSRVAHGISTRSISGRVRTRLPNRGSRVSRPRSSVSRLAHGISTRSINGVGWICGGARGRLPNRGSSLSIPRAPVSRVAHGISTGSINGSARSTDRLHQRIDSINGSAPSTDRLDPRIGSEGTPESSQATQDALIGFA